jgi:hypothetical protein
MKQEAPHIIAALHFHKCQFGIACAAPQHFDMGGSAGVAASNE